jgi:RNA polymerase sigma factor for flagellar operon FliA
VDYERLLLDNLELIDQVIRGLARRHRLTPEEVDDLRGAIRLKLVDDDYRVLRAFERRCSLRGYLTAVIHRHFLDERNAKWGKWRPSLEARRSGELAVLLEQLLTRDGLSFDEAVEVLRTNHGVTESTHALHQLSLKFPERTPRRFLRDGVLGTIPGPESADRDVRSSEQARLAAALSAALASALSQLPTQDRLILKLRYQDDVPVSRIARLLRLDQKPLYRRLEQVMDVLRTALERQGIARADVDALTSEAVWDIEPVIAEEAAPGIRAPRPSVQ